MDVLLNRALSLSCSFVGFLKTWLPFLMICGVVVTIALAVNLRWLRLDEDLIKHWERCRLHLRITTSRGSSRTAEAELIPRPLFCIETHADYQYHGKQVDYRDFFHYCLHKLSHLIYFYFNHITYVDGAQRNMVAISCQNDADEDGSVVLLRLFS